MWDADNGEYKRLSYEDFDSVDDFIEAAKNQMNALSLMDNTKPQEWSDLEAGDLMLYDLRSHNNPAYTGHTMIITGKEGNSWPTVEGHTAGAPLSEGKYTQEQFEGMWNGPYRGKGRHWNWDDMLQ